MNPSCLPLFAAVAFGVDPAVVVPPAPPTVPVATAPAPAVSNEMRCAIDATELWTHGYYQEVPLYGGFNAFRPYNYRDVLAQSQLAAGWGVPAGMTYSQTLFRNDALPAHPNTSDANQFLIPQQPPQPTPAIPEAGVGVSALPSVITNSGRRGPHPTATVDSVVPVSAFLLSNERPAN